MKTINEYVLGKIGNKKDFLMIRKVIHDNGGNFQSNLTAGMKNLIDSSLDNLSKREKKSRRR
jgi:hypothetical protein